MPDVASSTSVDVSLVVIAYNERDHAERCIRAILAQETDARLDVVFVDDGSTDGTAEVATSAATGDERFRLVRLPQNRGRGAARAAGVAAARGRVIGFVDADVTLPPDWLRRCLAELPGHAAVGGTPVPDGDAALVARLSGAAPRERSGLMPVTGSNVLYDAAVFAGAGFDAADRLGEDTRLSARLLQEGRSLRRIPGLMVRHEDSRTYPQGLRWRFENGADASSLPRELGVVRLADVVWAGWLATWLVGIALAVVASPVWLLLGVAATVGVAVMHVQSRFHADPVGRFLLACLVDVPLVTAYLLGRTVGIPRLIRGRP